MTVNAIGTGLAMPWVQASQTVRNDMIAAPARADSFADLMLKGVLSVLYGTAFAAAACAGVAALYLVKSALGINLMPGPSPLHDLLYPLISSQ